MNRHAALRITLSLLVLGGLIWWVDLASVASEVRRLDAFWVVLAVSLSVPQMLLSAWRWRMTARSLDLRLPWRHALGDYYLATFLNQVLPGAVLGDAARAWRHARASGVTGGAWRAVIIERLSGQVVMILATGLALGLSPQWHQALKTISPVAPLSAWWWGSATAIAVGGAMLIYGIKRPPASVRRLGRDSRRALLSGRVGCLQLLASVLIVTSYALMFVCAARAIGNGLPVTTLLALVPPVLLAMLIPLSVAGWGWREGAAALVWASVGLPAAQGVAVSLSYGVLVWLASLPGALCLLWRHRASSAVEPVAHDNVEKRVVTTVETSRHGASGQVEGIDGGQAYAGFSRTDQQGGNQQMQPIEYVGIEESRDRSGTALDQNPPVAMPGELRQQPDWRDVAGRVGDDDTGDVRTERVIDRCPGTHQMQGGRGSVLEHLPVGRNAAIGIEYDTCGVSSFDVTYRQARVVGDDRTGAHQHGIDQRAQPMQVNTPSGTVDVVRMPGDGGDTSIEALPELGDGQIAAMDDQRQQAVEQLACRGIDPAGIVPAGNGVSCIDVQGMACGLPAQGGGTDGVTVVDAPNAGPGQAVIERGQCHASSVSSSASYHAQSHESAQGIGARFHGTPHRHRRWADSEE